MRQVIATCNALRRDEVMKLLREQRYHLDQRRAVLDWIFKFNTSTGCPHVRADDRLAIERIMAGK